ncbi:hypothetical protein ACOMHN_001266 [Nucella lapillus]
MRCVSLTDIAVMFGVPYKLDDTKFPKALDWLKTDKDADNVSGRLRIADRSINETRELLIGSRETDGVTMDETSGMVGVDDGDNEDENDGN